MNFFEILRTGEIHPSMFFMVLATLVALIINVSVAKWRGYKINTALIAALIPFVNIYFSFAYLFIAMFMKDFIKSNKS